MEFLILGPLSPKTGYHFFEGGVGGWGGGGSKVFAQKAPSSGETYFDHTTAGRMVMQPTRSFRSAVQILVGVLLLAAAAARYLPDRGSNRRQKRLWSAALPFGHCLIWSEMFPHCLGPRLPLTKNPKCVFLSN